MSTRGRSRARGRPPKSQSGGRGSTKKPRYLYAGGHANTVQYRQRLREGLRQDVYADTETDSEPSDTDLVDFEMKYEDAELSDNIKMEMDSWRASSDEDRDDDEDYVEGGSVERLERSYPEERRRSHRRPTTPVFLQDREKPTLILPPSSEDLLLAPQFVMRALNVYEAMRRFSNILRLTPFTFEDFCTALDYPEHSALLSECHMSLLKAVLREADSLNTHFGPQDLKDSINIHFYLMDHITWPAALQLYLLADHEHRPTLLSFLGLAPDHDDTRPSHVPYQSEYPLNVGIECRLDILEFLVNQFLSTTPVRDEVVREGVPDHDDHCRVCHKLGDLLCCERCPAVFHLNCLDPPLDGVPTEEWLCPVCVTNSVPGVTNCISEMEKAGLLARHEMLGYDREGRKYWFLARRLIGEGEQKGDVRYYSSVSQVTELLCYLDGNDYEADLVRAINEQMSEIERQMAITMELTTAANKTSRKSWLDENQSDVETRIKLFNESVELMDIKPIKEEPVEVQTRSKTAAQSHAPFKLGSEGSFKTYSKLFTNHMLALNKHQHAEERDKKRHLSHKFSLTPASEFKWISIPSQATPVSDLTSVLSTIRNTLIHMESQLGSCLFHPQWTSTFRAEWLQAVNKSARTRDYVRALQLLESVVKPCALVSAWTECLGHTFLRRTTQVEREEKKKQDKKERRGIAGFMALYSGITEDGEDVSDRSLWCKYTLGLKHQVWKQKGEEFRITGTGGWYWNSRTRVVRLQPMAKCGLRAGPAKISVYIPSSKATRVVDVAKLENASVTKLSGEVADLKGFVLIRALCDQHRPEVEDVIDVAEALSDPRRRFYPRMTAGKTKLDALLDKRINMGKECLKKEAGKCDPDKILPPGLKCYSCTEASRFECFSPLCRVYAKHLAESLKRGDTKQKFDLGFRPAPPQPAKRASRKKILPPIQSFTTTTGQRRSVLVLDKVDYRRLSRKGGLGEAQGFNYLSKSNSEVWNYGSSPRPVLRTMWRWRNTQTLYNSCSWIALQLRVLWHCLKWDDIAMKPPPGGSNTVTTDTQVETSELVKRRDLAPYFLRSEYLVRKITVPIDLPTKAREKTTPQRSGLRERRRPESPQNKGPQISELWTPEEHLEIWELKIFQEKLEKQIKDRQQEKVRINSPAVVGDRVQLVHITPRTTVVTSGVTTTINSGNIVGVRVVGPGKSPEEIRATMEANLRAQRLAHQNNKKILSVTTTSNSTGSVVVTGGGILSGQGGTVMHTTIGGIGVRRIVAQAGQGQIAQVQTVRNTGPKQIIIRPAAANATVIASGSGTRLVSPSPAGTIIRQGGIRPQLQVNSELKTITTPVKSQVHLVQGPNGQLTVRGLQPGQQLLKLPDGRLQLVNINQQKPIALNALPASGQPLQKIMIQAAPTGQPGATGQRFIQIRPALPTGSGGHLPTTTVRAVKIVQAAQPVASPVVTAVSQAGSIIQAGSGQTVQMVQTTSGQAMVLNPGTVLTTSAGQAAAAAAAVGGGGAGGGGAGAGAVTSAGTTTLVHPVGGQLPQKVVLSTLGQSPQLIVTNTTTTTTTNPANVVPIKTEIKKEPSPSTATPKLIVTSQQLGSKLMNTMPSMQLVRATPMAAIKGGSTPQTVSNVSGGTTFVLTPAITQQIVKQGPINASSTPAEIQPKLIALPKHHATTGTSAPIQIQTKPPPSILPATKKVVPILPQTFSVAPVKPEPPSDDTSENLKPTEQVKATSTSTSASLTQPVAQASAVSGALNQTTCQQILGSIVTQVEKDDKRVQPGSRKQKPRDPELQRRFQRSKALVNRHADILRKSIMRKRALMEQKLALQVENEVEMEELKQGSLFSEPQSQSPLPQQPPQPLSQQLAQQLPQQLPPATPAPSAPSAPSSTSPAQAVAPLQQKKAATNPPSSLASSNGGTQFKATSVVGKKVQSHAPVKPTQVKQQGQQANRKRIASNSNSATNSSCPSTSPAKKKSKTMATPSKASSKVYCLCRRPYDPTKFMIGCDLCSNWFHTTCIGVTEAQAQTMEGWVCLDCTQKKSDTEFELYCICRTPYDESQFYIYCDSCQGWFHGRCVGVLQSEANSIDVYICPDCRIKTGADEESLTLLNKQLTKVDLDNLKKLLLAVKNHKQAWPFKEPVNRRQAPDYYQVIKNPMDLRTVEQNLNASRYTTLQQFVIDMTLIFDNCRYYNSKESTFYSCADLLEAFFVQKMKLYKEALQRRI